MNECRENGRFAAVHGLRYSKFYNSWRGMKERCNNPKHQYYYLYGGKGVNLFPPWNKFGNFMDDMYESYLDHVRVYGERDTTINRIDNDGPYSPKNCEWATKKKQRVTNSWMRRFMAMNPNGFIYISGNQKEFAKRFDLNRFAMSNCLNNRSKTHQGWRFKYIDG